MRDFFFNSFLGSIKGITASKSASGSVSVALEPIKTEANEFGNKIQEITTHAFQQILELVLVGALKKMLAYKPP